MGRLPVAEILNGIEVKKGFRLIGKIGFDRPAFILPTPDWQVVRESFGCTIGQFASIQRKQRLAAFAIVRHRYVRLRVMRDRMQATREVSRRLRAINRGRQQPLCVADRERRGDACKRTKKSCCAISTNYCKCRILRIVSIDTNQQFLHLWSQCRDGMRHQWSACQQFQTFVATTQAPALPAGEDRSGNVGGIELCCCHCDAMHVVSVSSLCARAVGVFSPDAR